MEQHWKYFLAILCSVHSRVFIRLLYKNQNRLEQMDLAPISFMLKLIQQSKWLRVTIIPTQYFFVILQNCAKDWKTFEIKAIARGITVVIIISLGVFLIIQWTKKMFKTIRIASKMKSIDLKWHFDCEFSNR